MSGINSGIPKNASEKLDINLRLTGAIFRPKQCSTVSTAMYIIQCAVNCTALLKNSDSTS